MRYRGFRVPRLFTEIAVNQEEAVERLYQGVVGTARGVLRLLHIDVTVVGAEHIPASGGALIAANHTGYPDFIMLGTGPYLRGERLVRFMAKQSVFEVPVLGWLLHKMQHVPVNRAAGASSVDAAVAGLRGGNLVGIFPEATISRSFDLARFKTGAARIAHAADVPLIPCAIWGSQRIWTKDLPKKLRGVPVIVRYGEPVALTGDAELDTAELKARMQALLDASRDDYATLYGPFETGAPWMPASLGGGAPTLEEADEMYRQERLAREAKKARRGRRGRGGRERVKGS